MSETTPAKIPDNLIAKSGFLAGSNPFMTIASAVLILGFVIFTVSNLDLASAVFGGLKNWIISSLDWFYVFVVSAVLFFVIWLPFSRFGHLKLGKEDDEPDFSNFSWFSMLFSAGLGSALLYWGVAEPLYHMQDNPWLKLENVEPNTVQAGVVALRVTLFHWGLHGWGVYVLVGLCLAYFSYRQDLPLTLRTALFPILKDKVFGFWGHVIDLLAIFGTVFGLATSLGMGVVAINAGLETLFGFQNSIGNQLILVGLITMCGTASAVSGVGRGVRILSEVNIMASFFLLAVFLILGPTSFILGVLITVTGDYLVSFVSMGFYVDSTPGAEWQSWWTIFYWGWWIAWCPFVGVFIARVSRGRTIREFVLCVLLVPATVLVIWLAVFGGGSIGMELQNGVGLVEAVNADYSLGIFKALEVLGPQWTVFPLTCLTTLLLISWFVTSSDSGTLVICTMLSMGDENPPIKFRLFWGILFGVVAGVLIVAGGLEALQTASIVAGFPLAIVLVLMGYGLFKALREEHPIPDVEDKYDLEFLNR